MDDVASIEFEDAPDDLRDRVKPELRPGERLLWAGRGKSRSVAPVVRPYSPGDDVALMFLGWLGVLFGLGFLTAQAGLFGPLSEEIKSKNNFVFIGTLLVCGGLSLAVAGVVVWRYRRSSGDPSASPFYALTDQRVISWSPHTRSEAVQVQSYERGQFIDVHRVELPDGSGDVICTRRAPEVWDQFTMQGVTEVRRVEELIRRFFVKTRDTVVRNPVDVEKDDRLV